MSRPETSAPRCLKVLADDRLCGLPESHSIHRPETFGNGHGFVPPSPASATPANLRELAEAIRDVNVRIEAFPPTERLDDMLGDRALAEVRFEKAATPAAILALYAEIDALTTAERRIAELEAERDGLRRQMSRLMRSLEQAQAEAGYPESPDLPLLTR